MAKYVVSCPDCGSQDVQEVEFETFKCGCKRVFDLDEARIVEEKDK